MVLVPGDATVDAAALARSWAAEVRWPRHRGAGADGLPAGAVPPCALERELPVVADPGVFAPAVVYCGGGTTTTMLKIRSADLEALLGRAAPIARAATWRRTPGDR